MLKKIMVVLTELCTVYHLTTTPTQYLPPFSSLLSHISSFKIEKLSANQILLCRGISSYSHTIFLYDYILHTMKHSMYMFV